MTTYPVGAFFCTTVTGPTGFAIALGQLLAGSPSEYQHAGIITSEQGDTVEAAPGGAFYGHLSAYEGRALLVSDAPVQQYVKGIPWGTEVEERAIRLKVTAEAHKLIGTPYSALDYAALACLHLHLPSRWVRARVESSGHLICSALVDRAYQRAGIQLFTDGRLPGDVMPADLAAWADAHEPVPA